MKKYTFGIKIPDHACKKGITFEEMVIYFELMGGLLDSLHLKGFGNGDVKKCPVRADLADKTLGVCHVTVMPRIPVRLHKARKKLYKFISPLSLRCAT